jgi:hypothetical protein
MTKGSRIKIPQMQNVLSNIRELTHHAYLRRISRLVSPSCSNFADTPPFRTEH